MKNKWGLTFILCMLTLHSLAEEQNTFSFQRVPGNLIQDAKNTVWGHEGVYFLLGLGAAFSFHPLDEPIANNLKKNPPINPSLSTAFGNVISPYTLTGLALPLWGASYFVKNPKFSLMTQSLVESFFWTGASVMVLKGATQRTRPNGATYSFPSMHSAFAFAAATTVSDHYGFWAALPAYSLAGFTAFSRMNDHKHYLTDVLAGAVIGTAFALGTSKTHGKKMKQPHAYYPMIMDGGIGFGFTTTY